ncbi:MAG: diguanylate cyclase [Dehalococcoidia bacterium]
MGFRIGTLRLRENTALPHLTLRTRALSVPLSVAILLAGVMLLLNISLHRQADGALWVEHTDVAIARGNQLMALILQRQSGLRGYLITRDQHFLEPYTQAETALPAQLASTRAFVQDNPAQFARLDRIQTLSRQWHGDVALPILVSVEQQQQPSAEVFALGQMLVDQQLAELDRFVQAERDLITSRTARAQAGATAATRLSIVGLVAALLLGLLTGLWSLHALVQPVRLLRSAVVAFGQGQQAVSLPLRTSDEVGDLIEAFDRMRTELQEASRRLEEERAQTEAERRWLATLLATVTVATFATDTAGSLTLLNPAAERLFGVAQAGALGWHYAELLHLPPGEPRILDRVLQNGAPVTGWHENAHDANGHARSYLVNAAPLNAAGGELIGGLEVVVDMTERVALERTLERVNQQLQELANHDPLTGIENRRGFAPRLAQELQRAQRYRHAFSVLLLDIDHFKQVNDTYGHPGGDVVLQAVATILKGQMRSTDAVARYGGEEFTVLLPETDGEKAQEVAERLREQIAAMHVILPEGSPDVTISIGVADYPRCGPTTVQILKRADQALYLAKQGGRNQVRFASAEP